MSRIIPERVVEHVEIAYWRCSKPEHRHRSKDVAARCIEKCSRPAAKRHNWRAEDLMGLLARHENGESIAQIARSLDLSYGRGLQLIAKARRIRWHRNQAAKSEMQNEETILNELGPPPR